MKAKKINYNLIFKPVNKYIHLSMFLAFLACVFKLAMIFSIAYTVKYMVEDSSNIPYLPLFFLIVCTFAYFILFQFSGRTSHLGSYKLEEILRTRLSNHIASLPLGVVIEKGTGYLIKVLQDDIKQLHAFVADSPPLKMQAMVYPVMIFIALFILNWQVSLVFLFFIVISAGSLFFLMRSAGPLREKYVAALGKLNSSIVEFVQAMPVIRTFDGGSGTYTKYANSITNFQNILIDWMKKFSLAGKLVYLLFNPLLIMLVIVIGGSFFFVSASLTFEVFFIFLLLATGVVDAYFSFFALLTQLEKSNAAIENIFDLEAIPPLKIADKCFVPNNNEIIFKDVSFKYSPQGEYVLKNINFKVEIGSFTALVGSSGAGKTTIANLLARFWDIEEGEISIGGVNIKNIHPDELINRISFVFQDNFLFSCSILDNIRYGMPEISEDKVEEAAKLALIHDFIMTLPEGYNTKAGERGINLSGGQKQRIAIARAILQNRPILVLDEPTSFTDSKNESYLMNSLVHVMKGKTVLMIAHRLSTIRSADQIVVFDKEEIVEIGNHQSLIDKNGRYAKLCELSSKAQSWHIRNVN